MVDFRVTGEASIPPERIVEDVDAIISKLDELKDKIDELDVKLDELSHKEVNIAVLIDGMDKLDELVLKLDEMEAKDHTLTVMIEIDGKSDLDKLILELLDLESKDHNVTVKVSTDGIAKSEAELKALDKSLDDTKKKTDSADNSANSFKFSWMLLAPALVPVVGMLDVLIGAAGGLSAAFVAMAIPLGVLAYTAKSFISQMSSVSSGLSTTAAEAASNATTFKQMYNVLNANSTAFQQMDPLLKAATVNYMLLQNAISNFQTAVEPSVLGMLNTGFQVLEQLLTILIPMVNIAAGAVTTFLKDFSNRLKDPTFTKWFGDIEKNLGTLIADWSGGVLNIIEGITAILDAFLPLGVQMSGGFLKMTQEFDKWAQHLGQSKGFKDFVAIVEKDGPILWNILGQVVKLIGNLFLALQNNSATTGFLTTIDNILKALNGFMTAHPGVAKIATDLLLMALAASKLAPLLGPIIAFIATPVGAVVTAIVGLAAGFLLLYKNSKTFRDWVQTNLLPMFHQFKQFLDQMKGDFIQLWPAIQKAWKLYGAAIMNLVKTDLQWIIAVVEGLLKILMGIFEVFLGLLTGNWSLAWKGIKNIFSGIWQIIYQTFKTLITQFLNDAYIFSYALKMNLANLWGAIEKGVNSFSYMVLGYVRSMFDGVVNWAISGGARLGASIASTLASVLNWFRNLPSEIVSALGNLGSLLVNAGEQLISGLVSGISNSFGSVQSILGSLTSALTSWKGPPSKDKTLLYSAGQMIIDGFVSGLESKYSKVQSSLTGLTNSVSKNLTTSTTAKISAAVSSSATGSVKSSSVGSGAGTSGSGSSGANVNFAAGSIVVNNPKQEQPGVTLTRTLQGVSRWGTIQTPVGFSTKG